MARDFRQLTSPIRCLPDAESSEVPAVPGVHLSLGDILETVALVHRARAAQSDGTRSGIADGDLYSVRSKGEAKLLASDLDEHGWTTFMTQAWP